MTVFEDSALAYAQNEGFNVFPLKPQGKVPLTEHGLDDATTDVMTIETWWARWPNANVGVRTGPIVVVDEDTEDALVHLAERLGETIPVTRIARTGTGRHYYFLPPEGIPIRNTASKLAPGIDTRGEGGYVVAPPSIHPNGTPYIWECEHAPVPLPAWLAELLRPSERERSPLGPIAFTGATTPYGQKALEEEARSVATAPEGTRNDRLNLAAFSLGQLVAGGELDEWDARNALVSAARACGLPDKEAEATIKSGFGDGQGQARSAPENGNVAPKLHVVQSEAPPEAPIVRSRAVDGYTFITAEPDTIPACWGSGDQVLWSEGEGLMIVGPDGVGKTTVAQQLVLARIGLIDTLLGQPISAARRKVLYIAADRPRQAARSFGRMINQAHYEALRERLTIWRGPLPFDITEDRTALANLAQDLEATDLFIDSLKDIAVDLAKDETGSRVNIALQEVIARGIELCTLHHQRKEGRDGSGKPKRLADVYGSRWLTAGMGSVICIWGEPGDLVVELLHLKQPAEDVGPYELVHDHAKGQTRLQPSATYESILREVGPNGITASSVASRIHKKEKPDANEIEKARRRLEKLIDQGVADRHAGPSNTILYRLAT